MEREMYNIVICDDEKDIVEAIAIYLNSQGYNVLKAYNGKEAVEIVGSEKVHLVVMDIMMPVMDGISTMIQMFRLFFLQQKVRIQTRYWVLMLEQMTILQNRLIR